jgi:Mrp family chromosome partitioning ATPase
VQAPLPASYRALAEAPELRGDPRIQALLDSLTDIEREREAFGAVGGVDPVFVALTSRANDLGRAIVAIADDRRNAIQSQLQPQAPAVATAPPVDTAAPSALRDSARLALDAANAELLRRRAVARQVDENERRARERASAVAPPVALLASAFVLSAVIGFAVALLGELRRPRVSDANELERYLGVRVLSTIETAMPTSDRGRREADRAAPPYFDPGAEGYQLAFLAIATDNPEMLTVTVTGDHPGITAVIACNMAAVAADEARNTLVVDLDPSCSASAALRVTASPGVVDVVHARRTWPDVIIPATVGRDKTISLVPYGVDARATAPEVIALMREGAERFGRYYDAVFLLAPAADVAAGLPSAVPAPEVVYCAQPGITPLRQLRAALQQIRAAGGVVRGIVLWHAERPLLPTPRELTGKRRPARKPEPQVAVAT